MPPIFAADPPSPKKIVLIAGKKSHGPEGNGIHDYPWSVKLLKVMFDNSNVAEQVQVEYHLDGWPEHADTLNDANAIMVVSDGRDGELYEEAPHFLTEEHRSVIAKQIARGCGFLTFHFSTFAPDKFADDILNWSGGYFDWETDGKRQWYSAIKTLDANVQLASPKHPVLRGVKPFQLREEFYYNIRFRPKDEGLKPLWTVPAVEGRAGDGNIVAWAKERADGGRGFGTTCGHFYENWQNPEFRKTILNALVWTAKGDVPAEGVAARFYTHAEITAALAGKAGTERAVVDERPIKALILTGDQYPGHLWKDTTPAIKEALQQDSRIQVDVSEKIEDLATDKITGYDLLVLNYCNWQKPGLSDAAKAGFIKYLSSGGGLIIIHFANGAFHFSLPEAGDSDWPEFRKICRRAWDHTPNMSGHDAYGKFIVDIARPDHPITQGMEPFETIDELYFRQQGEEPIEVLATAKSKVTGRDEPMAFVYQYGTGRVMQTVLGHAAESLRVPGVASLIHRSAAWVAGREPSVAVSQPKSVPEKPDAGAKLVAGKFGKALDVRGGGVVIAGHERFRQSPLTVECRAKLSQRENYNILVAQEAKSSATHWELFTMAGTGHLTAYLPGMKPDHITSVINVADDQWHYLAMIYEANRVRLFVDGKPVADQQVEFQQGKTIPGELSIGQLIDKSIGCTGVIDEVRISRGVKDIAATPDQPFVVEETTVGLWHFDELDDQGRTPDASSAKTPAQVGSKTKKPPSDSAFYHWSRDVVGFDWTEQDSVDNRWNQSDVGPFLASIVPQPGQPPVAKGLSIQVGDGGSVCYDTQTMALRSAWTGGFLKFDPARYGIIAPPQMAGDIRFVSSPDAGWLGKSINYTGLDLPELRLNMRIDGVRISELPEMLSLDDHRSVFIRTIQVTDPHQELRLRIGRCSEPLTPASIGDWQAVSGRQNGLDVTVAIPNSKTLKWQTEQGDVQLVIGPAREPQSIEVLMFCGGEWNPVRVAEFLRTRNRNAIEATPRVTHRTEDLITQGALGSEPGSYQVDTLTIPFDNPGKILFFITGHDFFSNGDLAACTVHGDVWRISGVDRDLKELRWRRFATGLFQPLGLKIVDDVVHVLGRDRITKLHDVDRDGFADRYDNFCDLYETSPGGHDYITCLETDPAGNFYLVHAKHGVQRVSKDGTKLETIATGLRNPNGLSVSPSGEITAAPQEGEWTPASAIFMVHQGDHYGYGGPEITPQRPLGYDPPLCWIPRLVDNSCAGQCWTPDDSWGLPANSLLHLSFGQCKLLMTVRDQVNGVWQGGVIPLPMKFQSGVNRGRFSPHDGQLYISGLKGWVTSAVQDGCLQRVRYVGGQVPWPVRMKTYRNGIALEFGETLDRETAENPENYSVQACNYRYAKDYGSSDWRPSQPTAEGREDWDVSTVTLLNDQRTVFLEIPELTPVMQLIVNWSITGGDQTPLANSFSGTVNRLPAESFAVPESSRKPRPGRLTAAEETRLRPGILFTLSQNGSVDALPARLLACGFAAKERPTSLLKPGLYEFRAAGFIKAPISGEYRFRIDSTSSATMHINQQEIGDQSTSFRLHKGYNRVELATASSAQGALTCRLFWQSDTFAEEPVPATVWYHDAESDLARSRQTMHRGRELVETFQCVRCHELGHADRADASETHAPNLKGLRGRMTDRWLTAWLLNPRSIRHDAEMPRLFDEDQPADRQAAADVAAYLLREDQHNEGSQTSSDTDLPGEILYEELGCIGCHRFTSPTETDPWNRTSFHFLREKLPGDTLPCFLRDPQRHYRFIKMPNFRLTEPESVALANYVTSRSSGRLTPLPEFARADARRGQRIFAERRCAHCHGSLAQEEPVLAKQPWPNSEQTFSQGCLADDASSRKTAPEFPWTDEHRTALRAFLKESPTSPAPLAQAELGSYFIGRLHCLACHHRDHVTSPRAEIVAEESDRGVIPPALPNLTWAGDKLQAVWMRQLFHGDTPRQLRTWLNARMPAFPAYADGLSTGFAAEYGHPSEPEPRLMVNAELADIGRKLTLKDGGLDCRQCHPVAGQQPTGDDRTKIAPGIDFSETKHRLRTEFYRRFVLDPPRFDVAIRMPKLALDGKTTQATGIFDGDAAQQFEALYHYIQSLPDLPNDTTAGKQ
ncbi:MAG: ThuA domain-containing protein [Planctomycetaceae bacterium]